MHKLGYFVTLQTNESNELNLPLADRSSAGVLDMCGYITSLSNLYYFKLALIK